MSDVFVLVGLVVVWFALKLVRDGLLDPSDVPSEAVRDGF